MCEMFVPPVPIANQLCTFIDGNSADLVNQLSPNAHLLCSHFVRISRHPIPNCDLATARDGRELVISLLKVLTQQQPTQWQQQQQQHVFSAFLCAILHCGHLALFCRLFSLHLVDTARFEQFAQTNDAIPLLPAGAKLQLPKEEHHCSSAAAEETTNFVADRFEFLQRHSQLLRDKLQHISAIEKLLAQWEMWGCEQKQPMKELNNSSTPTSSTDSSNNILTIINGEEQVPPLMQRLLDLLLAHNQHKHAFDGFCLALLHTQQFRLFSIFHEFANMQWAEQCLRHLATQQQQKWVEEAERELKKNMKKEDKGGEEGGGGDEDGENDEAEKQTLRGILADLKVETTDSVENSWAEYLARKNEIYANFSSPRGLALIINNHNFIGRQQREGSGVDEINMQNLLRQLGYKITLQKDLTAQEMLLAIRAFAVDPAHECLDSAIVVVMTHGELNGLLGIDDHIVDFDEFSACLNGRNAPTLMGKPKIFFVQACRGVFYDAGVMRQLRAHESCDGGGGGGPFSQLFALFTSRTKKSSASRTSNNAASTSTTPFTPSHNHHHHHRFNTSAVFRSATSPLPSTASPSPTPQSSHFASNLPPESQPFLFPLFRWSALFSHASSSSSSIHIIRIREGANRCGHVLRIRDHPTLRVVAQFQ